MKVVFLVIGLIASINLSAKDTLIFGEESKNQYLKSIESDKGYEFFECTRSEQEEICSTLFEDEQYFSRPELSSLSSKNMRYAGLAVVADGAFVIGGFVLGTLGGITWGAPILLGYTGQAAGLAGVLYFGSAGAAAGITADIVFDKLDPFVHLDTSIAYDVVIDTAGRVSRWMADVETINGLDVVIVEDINFEQLRETIGEQLASVKDIELLEYNDEVFESQSLY